MLLSSYLKNTKFDARIARLDMSSIFKFFEMKKKAILPVCIIVALTFNLRASLTLRTDGDQVGMTALPDLPDFKFVTRNLTKNQAQTSKDPWTVVVTVSQGFDDMFRNWWYYYSKLNREVMDKG